MLVTDLDADETVLQIPGKDSTSATAHTVPNIATAADETPPSAPTVEKKISPKTNSSDLLSISDGISLSSDDDTEVPSIEQTVAAKKLSAARQSTAVIEEANKVCGRIV